MAVINTREKYMDAALGKDKADLVIRGGKLVNVYTAEVYRTDITVKDKRIISVGNADYLTDDKTQVIDATDKYIAPGFIDAHIHIGGTHLTMTRWAEVLLKNGTTSLATDCYDIGVVAGKKGVRFAIDEANAMGINVLFVVPVVAYMQHNPFGNSNTFNESDLFDMLGWSECVGVNEPPVAWFLEKNPSILKLCDETLRQGKIIVGHGAGTFGEKLMAYLNMGPNSDHECLSSGEAIEKLRLGMQILMREGSAAVDLEHVIKAITEYNMPSENFMFCTDERDPVDFYEVGHLNYTMRKAITSGLNPIKAVQIATINAAKYYRKDHEVGSITPGKLADIIILNDLAKVNIDYVISKGEVVVKKGKYIKPVINVKYPDYMKCKINLKKAIELKDLVIKTDLKKDKIKVRVARCIDGTLVSEKEEAILKVVNGEVRQDQAKDIAKMIVIERHKAKGLIGKAFVSGFGLKKGAFAQTYNPVTDNIIVLGTSDSDMLAAIEEVQKIGGGFVVVEDGKRIAELPLPVLGILSDKSIEEVKKGFASILKAIRKLGSSFKSPILSLAFMAMAYGIPTYKLSEYGLVDIDEGKLVDNVIE